MESKWSELVIPRRSTVLILPLQLRFPGLYFPRKGIGYPSVPFSCYTLWPGSKTYQLSYQTEKTGQGRNALAYLPWAPGTKKKGVYDVDNRSYECKICHKKFRFHSNLSRHLKTQHDAVRMVITVCQNVVKPNDKDSRQIRNYLM